MRPPPGVLAGCWLWRSAGDFGKPLAMLNALKREKPWAKLRMSRKEYETRRPWKDSGVSRAKFEEYLGEFPDEAIDALYREADAEKLVESIFGKLE